MDGDYDDDRYDSDDDYAAGVDESFPYDGKQGRCSYYLDKKLRRKV